MPAFLKNLVLGFLLGALVATAAFRVAGFRIRIGTPSRIEQQRDKDKTDTMQVDPGKGRPRRGIA